MGRSCTEEELCERDTIEVRYKGISLGERGASQPDDGVTIRGWERLIESAGAHNLHHEYAVSEVLGLFVFLLWKIQNELLQPLWRIIRSKYGRGAFRQTRFRRDGYLTNYEYALFYNCS